MEAREMDSSQVKWHAAAALKAVQTFAEGFDKWSIISIMMMT